MLPRVNLSCKLLLGEFIKPWLSYLHIHESLEIVRLWGFSNRATPPSDHIDDIIQTEVVEVQVQYEKRFILLLCGLQGLGRETSTELHL